MAASTLHAFSGPAECRGVIQIGVDHRHIQDERTSCHCQVAPVAAFEVVPRRGHVERLSTAAAARSGSWSDQSPTGKEVEREVRGEVLRRSGGADGCLVQLGFLAREGAQRPLHPNHVDVDQTSLIELGS